jgi:hypothetical protein
MKKIPLSLLCPCTPKRSTNLFSRANICEFFQHKFFTSMQILYAYEIKNFCVSDISIEMFGIVFRSMAEGKGE